METLLSLHIALLTAQVVLGPAQPAWLRLTASVALLISLAWLAVITLADTLSRWRAVRTARRHHGCDCIRPTRWGDPHRPRAPLPDPGTVLAHDPAPAVTTASPA